MLRLRPYIEKDAQHVVTWFRDERTFWFWGTDKYKNYPISADELNNYYAAYANNDDFYVMTAFDDSTVVGHMVLRFLDESKTNLRFGSIIVDDSKRGKGYGKEMLELALKYAFEILKTKKVTVCVFDNNPAAYSCYEKTGFHKVTGKDPEIYHLMNEEWAYIELEMNREGWKNGK